MHEAIELIALETEQVAHRRPRQRREPAIVRYFGVGVMRPHLVQAQEKEDHRVGYA